MAYHNYIFTIFSGFSIVLVSVPFYWHLEAWNTGTCLYMFWTGLACLNFFVNSIIWNGNTNDVAPVWCDISSRIVIAVGVAVPASSLCISRRLYNIVSSQSVTITKSDKKRQVLIDLCIGLGIPIIQVILAYIVMGNRYLIYGDIGCYPAIENVYPAFPLVTMWPLCIGTVAACYSVCTFRFFIRRRRDVGQIVSHNSGMPMSRYYRLMALSLVEIFLTVPIGLYDVIKNAARAEPWGSWAAVHSNYDYIFTVPSLLWRWNRQDEIFMEMTRWPFVFCAVIFFVFFGFADEARRNYTTLVSTVAKKLGITTVGAGSSASVTSPFDRTHRPMYSAGGISQIASLPMFLSEPSDDGHAHAYVHEEKRTSVSDPEKGGADDDSIFGGRPLALGTVDLTVDGAMSATSSATYAGEGPAPGLEQKLELEADMEKQADAPDAVAHELALPALAHLPARTPSPTPVPAPAPEARRRSTESEREAVLARLYGSAGSMV